MATEPYIAFTNIFNPNDFLITTDSLDISTADKRYLRLSGGIITGLLTCNSGLNVVGTLLINGSPLPDLSVLSGLTAGTVTASKLVLVDANKDISSFRNLTSQVLIGSTRIETNSTSSSLITSSSLGSNYGLYLHSVLASSNGIYPGSSISFNNSSTDTIPLGNLCLDKIGSGNGDIVIQTRNSGTITERARFNASGITSTQFNISPYSLTQTNLGWFDSVTPGVASASHALVTGIFNEISGLFSVSSSNFSGDLIAPTSVSVTSGSLSVVNGTTPLTLRNTALNTGFDCQIQSTATGNVDCKLISPLSNTLMSLYANGKRQLTVNSSNDIVNIVNHNGSSTGLSLNGTLITSTATELNYCDITTLGTAQASKCLTTDASLNVTGINTISNTGSITTTINNNTTSLVTYQQWTNSLASPMTVQMLMSNIAPKFGTLNAYDFRLMTNNITAMWISQSNQFVSIGTGTASYKLEVQTGDCNLTSGVYRLAGTDISTAISGITAGTVAASKAVIVDSSKNIVGFNTVNVSNSSASAWSSSSVSSSYGLCIGSTVNTSTDQLGSSLCFTNDSSTTSNVPFGALHINRFSTTGADMYFALRNGSTCKNYMALANTGGLIINNSTTTGLNSLGGYLTVQTDGQYLDGSYSKGLFIRSDNVDPISFTIEVNNGSGLTSTNAAWIGTASANDLRFGCGLSTKMTLVQSTGYLGIGTTTPSAPLTVSGSASLTFNAGGSLYSQTTTTASTFSQLGPVTFNTGINTSSNIACTSIYCLSDRRCKEKIEKLPEDYINNLYQADVYSYKYKNTDETLPKIGFISQDLHKLGYVNLLSLSPNENLKKEEEFDIEGFQMSIDYDKISACNFMMIKKLMNRINELEDKLKK